MVFAENRVPRFGIMLSRTTKVAWRDGFGKAARQPARPFCRFFPVFSQAFAELPARVRTVLRSLRRTSQAILHQFGGMCSILELPLEPLDLLGESAVSTSEILDLADCMQDRGVI